MRRTALGAVLVSIALGTSACGLPPAPPATPDIDLVLGGTWITVSVSSGSETGGMTPEDALVAIGAEIAAG